MIPSTLKTRFFNTLVFHSRARHTKGPGSCRQHPWYKRIIPLSRLDHLPFMVSPPTRTLPILQPTYPASHAYLPCHSAQARLCVSHLNISSTLTPHSHLRHTTLLYTTPHSTTPTPTPTPTCCTLQGEEKHHISYFVRRKLQSHTGKVQIQPWMSGSSLL